MKSILCFLACLTTSPLLADYTYAWSGNYPRFTGSFSISDGDFANREFTNLTTVNFQFHDSQDPSHDVILNSLLDLYGGGNDSGSLTSDGLHLDHNQNAFNPNTSFWVAAWQYPGINVGLYSWNPTGDSLEYFDYANYTDHIFAETTGNWSLQTVPEPSSLCLIGIGCCLMLARKLTRQNQKT
jgi:PEP-CTERM motif